MITILKVIAMLNTSPAIKTEITRCALYGVRKEMNIDLADRLKGCIKLFIKEDR